MKRNHCDYTEMCIENFCEVLPALSAWIHSTATPSLGSCLSQGLYPERKHASPVLLHSTDFLGFRIIPSTIGPQSHTWSVKSVGRMSSRHLLMSTAPTFPFTFFSFPSQEHDSSLRSRKPCLYFLICSVISITLGARHLKFKGQNETLISFLKQPLPNGNEWAA